MEIRSEPARASRLVLLGGYFAIVIVLIAGSEIRRVGDGREYLGMTQSLLHLELPVEPVHFWLYSALAVPVLALLQLTALDPIAAFVPVNLVLLGSAFWMASGALRWPALAMLFLSPIVWWIDKAHTEIFTFALLTIALLALGSSPTHKRLHPGWAVVCLGAAAAQNPPFVLLVPLAALLAVMTGGVRFDDRRFLAMCAAGAVLAALHPIFFLFTEGQLTGLSNGIHGRVPNLDEVLAVIRDSNIGVIPNAPVLVACAVFAFAIVAVGSPRALWGADTVLAACAGVLFLASFAQTTNFDHGGTPGMSRYATWLIPLAVPILRRIDEARVSPPVARSFAVLTIASCIWSVVAFHPRLPQSSTAPPTWFASWLWKNHPSFDRPLPEVFAERLTGPGARRAPIASPGCTKILLIGHRDSDSIWPWPCLPAPVPADCRQDGALCYADRNGAGYSFSRPLAPSVSRLRFDEDLVWHVDQNEAVRMLLARMNLWDVPLCQRSIRSIEAGATGVGGAPHYCGADRVLAYFRGGEGARVVMRLARPMSGVLVDAATGDVILPVAYTTPGTLLSVPIPAGPEWAVLALTAAE